MATKNQKTDRNTIAVVGLGYVGLTLGVVFAEEGSFVIGIDSNTAVIDSLENGMPHFFEPGLEDKLIANKERLTFSPSIKDAVNATAYIISVGSNVDKVGKPDYTHVEGASRDIGSVLKKGDIVILRSTVTIGTTRTRVVPILEKTSGLSVGKDFFVAFAPERTIEGKALEELHTLPQVIAGFDKESRDVAEKLFSRFAKHIVLTETLEEAELVKLISNSYRDLSFAFANGVALIASEHNVNVNTVIAAANEGYERNRIPLPSPGVGGYCLTKDPLLLAHGTKKYPDAGGLMRQGRVVNQMMTGHVADIVTAFTQKFPKQSDPSIVIVGLAFKGSPATSDVRFSPSEMLISHLKERGFTNLSGFDPHVAPEIFEGWQIGRIEDIEKISSSGDIVILMHRHEDYMNHHTLLFGKDGKSGVSLVLDTWGMYNNSRELINKNGVAYANLGYRSFE